MNDWVWVALWIITIVVLSGISAEIKHLRWELRRQRRIHESNIHTTKEEPIDG